MVMFHYDIQLLDYKELVCSSMVVSHYDIDEWLGYVTRIISTQPWITSDYDDRVYVCDIATL